MRSRKRNAYIIFIISHPPKDNKQVREDIAGQARNRHICRPLFILPFLTSPQFQIMKQTSKDKVVNESLADKLALARDLKREERYPEAIEAYHKVLFLREQPQFMLQLAQIYQKNYDTSSAILFYRRTFDLNKNSQAIEKVKFLSKVQGLQLMETGSIKNILEDTEFEAFFKRYPAFHKRMMRKVQERRTVGDYLESCFAYLQVNQRQLALSEIENCITTNENDADLVVLHALIYWSINENEKGYREFWNAYKMDKTNPEVVLFIQMITPELEKIYKEAKYDLIDHKVEKCKLKVKKGLEMHPYHTQFLILSAYIHRSKEEYELALSDLQLANKHIEDRNLEGTLRDQISLTYNEMGIFLYRQSKFNEALTLFTEGLTFKSNDWGMLTNRGDCHKALNNYLKALQDFLAAYQIQKKNDELNFRISSIYSIRGVALFNSKNYELSLKEFQESLRYSPKCPQFYLSKAKCLLQLNCKAEAVEQLERCLALDGSVSEAAVLLQQNKQPEDRTKVKHSRKVIQLSKEK